MDDNEASEPAGSDAEEAEELPSTGATAAAAAEADSDSDAEGISLGGLESELEKARPAKQPKAKCAAVTSVAAAAAAGGRGPAARTPKRTTARPAPAAAAAGQPHKRRASTPAALPPRPPAPAAVPGPSLPCVVGGGAAGSTLRRTAAAGSSNLLSDLAMPPAVPPPGATAAGAAGTPSPALADSTAVTGFSSFVQECRAAFQVRPWEGLLPALAIVGLAPLSSWHACHPLPVACASHVPKGLHLTSLSPAGARRARRRSAPGPAGASGIPGLAAAAPLAAQPVGRQAGAGERSAVLCGQLSFTLRVCTRLVWPTRVCSRTAESAHDFGAPHPN